MAARYVVRSASINGFFAEVGEHAEPILREVGVDPDQLSVADNPIEIGQLHQMLALAAGRLNRPDLGMRLAQHQSVGDLGLLGKVLSCAATLREAFAIAQRYMSLHSSAEHWQLHQFAGRVQVARVELGQSDHQAQQYHEMALAVFHRMSCLLSGEQLRPLRVTFAHSQVGPMKLYQQHFGCEVLFDQEHDSLSYPAAVFRRPLPVLAHRHKVERAGYIQAARDQLEENLELNIRNLITELLGLKEISVNSIAALLNLHPRSLQRRLKQEHLVFRDLLQDVRVNLACWHLQASRCDITSLSDMLGYSDLSSFSRAFRRRMGVSPAQWRQRVKVDAVAPC